MTRAGALEQLVNAAKKTQRLMWGLALDARQAALAQTICDELRIALAAVTQAEADERDLKIQHLEHVISDKYPAPPNFYLRALQTDLAEAREAIRLADWFIHHPLDYWPKKKVMEWESDPAVKAALEGGQS